MIKIISTSHKVHDFSKLWNHVRRCNCQTITCHVLSLCRHLPSQATLLIGLYDGHFFFKSFLKISSVVYLELKKKKYLYRENSPSSPVDCCRWSCNWWWWTQTGGSWVHVRLRQMTAAAPTNLYSAVWQRNWTKRPDHRTNISPCSGGSGFRQPESSFTSNWK